MKRTFADELTRTAGDSVDLKEFAGGIPQEMALSYEILSSDNSYCNIQT